MAENLGEVRVNIEEEGAQDAADTIGDAMGEAEVGGDGQGGGAGGGGGGLLGGISAKLTAILGLVAFLSSLKPIQELLSGLQRLFSVAILPLVALLTTFLRPILQELLRFIAGLDFDNIVQSLTSQIGQILSNFADGISTEISQTVPGIGGTTADRAVRGGVGGAVAAGGTALFGPLATDISFDFMTEQSRTSLDSNTAGTVNNESNRNGVGGE